VAETKGDHAIKGKLSVSGNATASAGFDQQYLEVVDQKTKGSVGGLFYSGEWRTRDLTATPSAVGDGFATSITLATITGGGGQIVLPAGRYYVDAIAPAYRVDAHQARLADVTDNPGNAGATVVLGTTEFAANADAGSQTTSKVTGRFTITRSTTLEVQHKCKTTRGPDGFGYPGNFYQTNNYFTSVKMWQVEES
jgi:hypothetical protein